MAGECVGIESAETQNGRSPICFAVSASARVATATVIPENNIPKLAPPIMFASVAGISNQQSYSFQGPVDAALMLVIAASLVAITYPCFAPLRPERKLVLWMDRFFQRCADVVSGYASDAAGDSRTLGTERKRSLQSMVLSAPPMIKQAIGELDTISIRPN